MILLPFFVIFCGDICKIPGFFHSPFPVSASTLGPSMAPNGRTGATTRPFQIFAIPTRDGEAMDPVGGSEINPDRGIVALFDTDS